MDVRHVWSVRVRADGRNDFHVHARNHSWRVSEALSFDIKSVQPCALEQLLGALASDLLATLQAFAKRRRIVIDALEAQLSCELNNALMHLGVIGEKGSPRISTIDGAIYISTDAPEDEVQDLWAECKLRSPLYETLRHAVVLRLRLCQTI